MDMSPEAVLHNLTLDLLYKMNCEKKTNAQMRDELQRRRLPPLTDAAIDVFRGEFRVRELKYPDAMRVFRRRLGLQ
jgi:hypothetical protein